MMSKNCAIPRQKHVSVALVPETHFCCGPRQSEGRNERWFGGSCGHSLASHHHSFAASRSPAFLENFTGSARPYILGGQGGDNFMNLSSANVLRKTQRAYCWSASQLHLPRRYVRTQPFRININDIDSSSPLSKLAPPRPIPSHCHLTQGVFRSPFLFYLSARLSNSRDSATKF